MLDKDLALDLTEDAAIGSLRREPPAQLPTALDWALFLDFDGTLCGYREDPAEVALDEPARDVLQRLAERLDGAICILSGRSADDLERILGALKLPRVAEHGGGGAAFHDADYLAQVTAAENDLLAVSAAHANTWVERKPSSCVLHYRQAPHLADCLRKALLPLLPRYPRLRLLDGIYVFEFTARERDKGTALSGQMQLPPFAGRKPVVVGDDVTDEDAFEAALRWGGFGIGVGARTSLAARFHLEDHEAVMRWLAGLCGGAHAPQA